MFYGRYRAENRAWLGLEGTRMLTSVLSARMQSECTNGLHQKVYDLHDNMSCGPEKRRNAAWLSVDSSSRCPASYRAHRFLRGVCTLIQMPRNKSHKDDVRKCAQITSQEVLHCWQSMEQHMLSPQPRGPTGPRKRIKHLRGPYGINTSKRSRYIYIYILVWGPGYLHV